MTLPKVSLVLTLMLVLASMFAAALPETTTLGPPKAVWAEFETAAVEFDCPDGFRADDPYHHDLAYRGFGWLSDVPPPSTGMAFLTARDGGTEAFLVRGTPAELEPILAAADRHYRGDRRVSERPRRRLELAAGGVMEIRTTLLRTGEPPGSAGPGFVALLGVARRGGEWIVLNAGGPETSFREADLLEMVRTLRLPPPD